MTSLLLLLVGCDFLGEARVEYWGGWSTEFDDQGAQVGTAEELLVLRNYAPADSEIVEESWRFGEETEQQAWPLTVIGSRVDSRFTDDFGDVAIQGEMTAGEPYDWSAYTLRWTWLNGERAGDWIELVASETTDGTGTWLHMEKTWRTGQDVLIKSRTEDIAEHDEETWNGLLAEYGG